MSYEYIRVRFGKAGECYQEILAGYVQRYVSEDGSVLFEQPPIGDRCEVIEAEPIAPTPLKTAGDARLTADRTAAMRSEILTPDSVDAALATITSMSSVREKILAAEVLRFRAVAATKEAVR